MSDRFPEEDPKEPFVAVPHALLNNLSPERYKSLQQLYETAFELARQKVKRQNSDVEWNEGYHDQGEGI